MPFDPHPEVTADDVQNAVDDADGHHDGDIAQLPENDVQAVHRALDTDAIDERFAVLALLDIAILQPGVNEGESADWARIAARLGPSVLGGLLALVRKLGV